MFEENRKQQQLELGSGSSGSGAGAFPGVRDEEEDDGSGKGLGLQFGAAVARSVPVVAKTLTSKAVASGSVKAPKKGENVPF